MQEVGDWAGPWLGLRKRGAVKNEEGRWVSEGEVVVKIWGCLAGVGSGSDEQVWEELAQGWSKCHALGCRPSPVGRIGEQECRSTTQKETAEWERFLGLPLLGSSLITGDRRRDGFQGAEMSFGFRGSWGSGDAPQPRDDGPRVALPSPPSGWRRSKCSHSRMNGVQRGRRGRETSFKGRHVGAAALNISRCQPLCRWDAGSNNLPINKGHLEF